MIILPILPYQIYWHPHIYQLMRNMCFSAAVQTATEGEIDEGNDTYQKSPARVEPGLLPFAVSTPSQGYVIYQI